MTIHKRMARLLHATLWLTLLAATGTAQQVGAGKSFEGMLEFKYQTVDRVQYFEYLVKGDRIRIESVEREDTSPIILVDHGFKKTYYILPHREQYVELGDFTEPAPGQSRTGGESGIQKTEETGEVEGFACEQFLVKTEDGEIELWATRELGIPGTFYTGARDPAANPAAWENLLLSQGYFPLVTITKDSEGYEVSRFELSSVKKKTLSESLFRVSPDYEKISLQLIRPKLAPGKARK